MNYERNRQLAELWARYDAESLAMKRRHVEELNELKQRFIEERDRL